MSRHARCSEEGWQWAEGCGCLLLDPPPRTGGEGVSAVSAGLVNLVLVPVSLSMYVRKVQCLFYLKVRTAYQKGRVVLLGVSQLLASSLGA